MLYTINDIAIDKCFACILSFPRNLHLTLTHRFPCANNIPPFVFSNHAKSYTFHLDYSFWSWTCFQIYQRLSFLFLFLLTLILIFSSTSLISLLGIMTAHRGGRVFISLAVINLLHGHHFAGWVQVPQQARMCPLTARITVHPWPGGSFISCRIFQG